MSFKINSKKLVYVIIATLSLFFIDNGNSIIELLIKLTSIFILFFYYITKTKAINYYYVLVMLLSCFVSSFLIYDITYLLLGASLMFANRILYVLISRKAMRKVNYKMLVTFFLIFLIPVVVIYPQLKTNLGQLTYPVLGIALTSVIMCSFAFVNYFTKMIIKNKFYVFGMLLFVFADTLMVYNSFINYNIIYVIIYTSVYYLARYLVCESLIVEKISR